MTSGDGYVQLHQSDPDPEKVFDEANWIAANPSWDFLPDLQRAIRREAEDAKRSAQNLAMFRALRMNLGTEEVVGKEVLIPIDDWRALERAIPPAREGPLAIGVDLGGGVSMSAIAFYWPETGRLETYGALPSSPNLEERGLEDGVGSRYSQMHQRGELFLYPGRATNNVAFLKAMARLVEGQDILAVAADRYKMKDLEQVMMSGSLNWEDVMEWRAVGRGEHGGQDIRAFQGEVYEAHLCLRPSLLMSSAIAESVIIRDTNGNPALNKARQKGRNDALQASLLAVGLGRRWRIPSENIADPTPNDFVLTEMYG